MVIMIKKVIINSDDFGATKNINRAIFYLIKNKCISSTSIIPNSLYFNHAIKLLSYSYNRNFSVGVHLNLTLGSALSPDLKYLCDNNNVFKNSPYFFFSLILNKNKKDIIKEIYKEFDAQIMKARKFLTKKISHLDSHNHIHMNPLIFKIVRKLAKKYKIKHIRYVNEEIILNNFFINFQKKLRSFNYLKLFLIKLCNLFNKIKINRVFYGLADSGYINKKIIENIIKFSKSNILEICIHPSISADGKNYYNNNDDYNAFNSPWRQMEFRTLIELSKSSFSKSKFYKLTNYNEI
jgi:predicted glycoside hydrolase/deacetylase ChbG (UPF0249 family)